MEIISVSFLVFVVILVVFGVKIVPQSEIYLVQRLGKYNRKLGAGFHFIIPLLETAIKDKIRLSLKQQELGDKNVSAITKDNVTVNLKLSVIYRLAHPDKTYYRFDDVKGMLMDPIISVVRSNLGKTALDAIQSNRSAIDEAIVSDLTEIMAEWGIVLTRVDIVDIVVDEKTKDSMLKQLDAERVRRASVLEAQGEKESMQLKADGETDAAQKQAEGQKALADAEAYSLKKIAESINNGGELAVRFRVKEIEANALSKLGGAKDTKYILLPADLLNTFKGFGPAVEKFVNKDK
jgi:regulator of protease activity HflC (stomatin/prohibitin superfamily)